MLCQFCTALWLTILLLMVTPSRAQTDNAAVYTVAYVDVLPTAAEAARAALKQYRNASRKERGYTNIELLEQLSQPGRYVVLEQWQPAAALDTHAANTASTELQNVLRPARISSYDQRVYRMLTAPASETTTNNNAQAVYVVTHVDIGGPSRDSGELLQQFAKDSRSDSGNLRFEVLQGVPRGNHFTLISEWKDQSAYSAHRGAIRTRNFRNAVEPLTGSPLDERIYKLID